LKSFTGLFCHRAAEERRRKGRKGEKGVQPTERRAQGKGKERGRGGKKKRRDEEVSHIHGPFFPSIPFPNNQREGKGERDRVHSLRRPGSFVFTLLRSHWERGGSVKRKKKGGGEGPARAVGCPLECFSLVCLQGEKEKRKKKEKGKEAGSRGWRLGIVQVSFPKSQLRMPERGEKGGGDRRHRPRSSPLF